MVISSILNLRRCLGAGAAVALLLALGACSSTTSVRRQILRDGRQVAFRYVEPDDNADAPRRIVFIHGAPADASSWDTLLDSQAALLDGCEVIALDRLGYGRSMPAATASLQEDARSIEPLLTPGTILVGHSYGAPIALRAAAAFPDRVGGLVLVAAATDPAVSESRWAMLGDARRRSPAAERELAALADENATLQPMLADVRCPVVIIHGDADPLCPHDRTLDHLERALVSADLRFVSVHGGGHNLHRTHPRLIASEIARLAEALEPISTQRNPRGVLRGLRLKHVYRPCDFPAEPDDGA